jgi:hypothetical protein
LAFKEMNVGHVCGIDGAYVNSERLLVPRESFVFRDLNQPFDISGRYDLAMSLEVAEHLSATAGERLVHALSQAAPLVLFSAAVPGQGGSHLSMSSGRRTGVRCSRSKGSACSIPYGR